MDRKIRHIAEFLETPIDETKSPSILHYCRFDYMKEHATKSVPLGVAFWDGGAQPFIHKGINGRWRDILSADGSLKHGQLATENLGEDCAQWLANREMS